MAVFKGLVVGSFLIPLSVVGAETSSEKVQRKASETLEATQELALEKKASFESKVRSQMKEIDVELAALKKKAQGAGQEARAGFNDQISALEVKREALSTKLQQLSKSSGKAWDRLKVGVEAAWADLKTAVDEAGTKLKE